ncbi:hypothetical protein BH09ACT12_BH09ACT12_11090 [soil metagenome]
MHGTISRLQLAVLVALAALVISFTAVVPATARPAPTNLVKPSVAGKPVVGKTLTCRAGKWTGNPTSFRFAWKRDGQPVKHASGRHYRVTRADRNTRLSCAVRAAGSSQRVVSRSVAVVDAPTNTVAPSITGLPKPGQTLTCHPGTWTNGATLRYSWTRDGSPAGTGPTRLTQPGDLGTRLVCLVAGSNIAGGSGFVASAAVLVSSTGTVPVPTTAPLNTVKPSIVGDEHPGVTLTCDPGTWTGDPTFTFSWTRNGSPAGTGPTRLTRPDDVGTALVCLVAGSNTAGGSGGVSSDPVFITALHVAYQAITGPTASAYPSLGYAATQTNEWGDLILLDGGATDLTSATVTMVSWACETGYWNLTGPDACVTTPGSTFVHPLTLNIYAHDSGAPDGVGALLKTVTVNATIPYRPSADSGCADPKQWMSPDLGCVNGISAGVTFDLDHVSVPEDVIVSVAFNTTNWGYHPVGGAGGPYDALNVAAILTPPSVGTNVDPDATLLSSGGPLAPLVTDTGWGGYTPGIRLEGHTP